MVACRQYAEVNELLNSVKKIVICIWMSLKVLCLSAQDPQFSQFYAAPLNLNPAFAGNTEAPKIGLNYRNQWPSISQAYVTYMASYDQFLPYINSGIGFSVLADDAGRGLYRTVNFNAYYSYKVIFEDDLQMRLGVHAGYISSRVAWSRLVFLDQLDPEFGAISPGGLPYPTNEVPPETGTNVSAMDISAGFLVFNRTFYAGLALKHLNSPEFSFLNVNPDLTNNGLPIGISLHTGAELDFIRLGSLGQVYLAPNAQFVKQGEFMQLNIGTIFRYYKVGTGVWYRHANTNPDALIFLIEGRHDIYRIGYSYDMTLSSLNGTGGAHEISFIVNFEGGKKESRYNDCFNLFR